MNNLRLWLALTSAALLFTTTGCADDAPAPSTTGDLMTTEGALLPPIDEDPGGFRCREDYQCGRSGVCDKRSCEADYGKCRFRPHACTEQYQPVCGCDGQTYSNDCFRLQAGAVKAHDGSCHDTCGGIQGEQCGPRQVCINAPGSCDIVDNQGECLPRPRFCSKVLKPVCGCDGVTYHNACLARRAGVSLAHEGRCATACEHTAQCPDPEHQWCEKRQCGGVGLCMDRPDGCPENYDPVCGCNGVTYGNTCEANAAGWVVRSQGACEGEEPGNCCNPETQPGANGNPTCFEGATCCPDGEWRCNSGDGSVTCADASFAPEEQPQDDEAAEFRPIPAPSGQVCEACCNPDDEPGTDDNPTCFEGATCCGNGRWACNSGDGSSTCEVNGHACEGCQPVLCEIYCQYGFATGSDGCEICACNPAPDRCCAPDRQPGTNGNPHCFEGATCCPSGDWQCNAGDGSATCASAFTPAEQPQGGGEHDGAAEFRPAPQPTGEVCTHCCDPGLAVDCLFGVADCCGDGRWVCPDQGGSYDCRQFGQKCPASDAVTTP